MPSFEENLPAHERIYRLIRDKILFGDLAPGQAVTIQGLADETGTSMTPVREAIRRLTAEGALEFQGNRRVSVPVLGRQGFGELAVARLAIESELAEMAAKNMDSKAIDALEVTDDLVNMAIKSGDVRKYMHANHAFHFFLYERANSHVLLPLVKTLWLRYGPLSKIICGRVGTINLIDQHEEAIAALRNGDAAAAGQAIRRDIEQGFQIVYDGLDTIEI